MKRSFPLAKIYTLLEPGPVVLLTTAGKDGPDVLSPCWNSSRCVISNRDCTFSRLKKIRGCVINIPTVDRTSRPGKLVQAPVDYLYRLKGK